MKNLTVAFSTCPNDTFMFQAMVKGQVNTEGFSFQPILKDIFHLNQMAQQEGADIIKVSYNTFGKLTDSYALLDSGSALGHNCGPLLISKNPFTVEELIKQDLPVAIPGKNTTANLLLGYYAPEITNKREYLFHEIMPAILREEVAAGVIIHENRFTYQQEGLKLIQDLGEYWESKTNLPIPLGAILAKKSLGKQTIDALSEILRFSIQFAFDHPDQVMDYVASYAQEMDEQVMRSHIDLYVNEYSLSLGKKGKEAVRALLQTGIDMGLYPYEVVPKF
ncbi:MAG: 1,4-dihydroxy-6-naphthoate synthase [Bacteroidota bacterium]